MKKLKTLFLSRFLLRGITLFSLIFVLCLVLSFSKGQQHLLSFIKNYKLSSILALLVLAIHLAIELKVAIEDYVSQPDRRAILIKIFWGSAMIAGALVGITIGQL